MRDLTQDDLLAIEIGAAILGTGGGGNPYIGRLRCQQELRKGNPIRLAPLDALPDEAWVGAVFGLGAPVVSVEKLRQGEECLRALRAVEAASGRRVSAVIPWEIGGANAMAPMVAAAQAGLPVLDGDGMGRAFPKLDMSTYSILGHAASPAALADDKGNVVVLHAIGDSWAERLARQVAVTMGGSAGAAIAPMPASFVRRAAVPGTVNRALALGQVVQEANRAHRSAVEAILALEDGRLVFEGKITDLERRLEGGFARGAALFEGFGGFAAQHARIAIQNEFLLFERDGLPEVSVPDLIVVLDHDTGHPITTEMLRFGQRCAVLAFPCHPLLRSAAALRVVGPAAMGLGDVAYRPLATKGG